MTGSVAEKGGLDRRISLKVHSPRSNGLERSSSSKSGVGKTSCGRSFSAEKDGLERGSRSWAMAKKEYGSDRHGASKHEGARRGNSLESERFEEGEPGRGSYTRAAAKIRDLSDRDPPDRGEEHRSSFRKGLSCGRDGVERKERAKVIFLKDDSINRERSERQNGPSILLKGERRDREGSASQKEGSDRVEKTKILSLKALNYERDGRGKVRVQDQFSPSPKGQTYERMMEFRFPKGARSERDRSKREEGSKVQSSRDLHCRSAIAEGNKPIEKLNSTPRASSSEFESKDGEDTDRHTSPSSPSDGQTVGKDKEQHITKESDGDTVEKEAENGNNSSLEEGSCIPAEYVKDRDVDNTPELDNNKVQSPHEKSEMEEGELNPEEDDVEQMAESKATEQEIVVDVSLMTGDREVKGENIAMEEEGAIVEQASSLPEVVIQDAGEKGEVNDSLLGSDAPLQISKEAEAEMEVEVPCNPGDEGKRDGTESQENMKGAELHDEVRTAEIEEEKKTDEKGSGECEVKLIAEKHMMASCLENQGGRETFPETENVEKGNSDAGTIEQATDIAGIKEHGDSNEQLDVALESEDRHQDKKQKVERLEPPFLSLSLPDTSLCLGSPGAPLVPRAPSRNKSIQSMATSEAHSDGVTTSLSLSCSLPFVHNPSCSLTQTSFDNQDFSTASQQVSQGNDRLSYGSWQVSHGGDLAGSQRPKSMAFERRNSHGDLSLYQQSILNGNLHLLQGSNDIERGKEAFSHPGSKTFKHSLASEKIEGGQISHGGSRLLPSSIQLHRNNPEGSQGKSLEDRGDLLDRSNKLLLKELQDRPRCKLSSPSPSIGSREKWSEQHNLWKDRKDDKKETTKLDSGFSGRPPNVERNEELSVTRHSFGERVGLSDIVTYSIPVVAKKVSELPENYLHMLKESLKDMLGTFEKREEFSHLQKILQRRTDLSMESLLRAHRAQLEILVSIKTGIPAFLNRDNSLTNSAMLEIFLQLRCRNIHCQSQLPADDCDCQICARKNGFCSACMCVVCSNFDFDANTCRWVGCDFCMHWCHTDCGLRSSSIMPGQSIKGAAGTSEMQFRCMACSQKSELFGFVKDVFTTCAESWPNETLAKELQCVYRIFHASQDARGKQLCKLAQLMLSSLDNGVETAEVCQRMLRFFTDPEIEVKNMRDSRKSAFSLLQESNILGDAARGLYNLKPATIDQSLDLEKALVALRAYDRELEEKRVEAAEIQYDKSTKKAEIEELESQMRIKQAESHMFQVQADEARRQAEGLRCIVLAKCEMIKDEYATKAKKLHLHETEERRKRRLEELQICERSADEFCNMKVRLTADIQDLLRKLEATKCQLL